MINFNKLIYSIFIITALIATGCNKFLDVKPEDKFVQDQVFTNKSNINQVLNGIYMQMASSSLYGENLSWTTLELMGQRFNTSVSGSPFAIYSGYTYTDADNMSKFSNIWEKS